MALDMTLDVVQMLNANALTQIRREYKALQLNTNGLTIQQFVKALSPFVPRCVDGETYPIHGIVCNLKLIGNAEIKRLKDLSELFKRIDTDQSGTVDWDEFTSYCVESGVAATSASSVVDRAHRETVSCFSRMHRHAQAWGNVSHTVCRGGHGKYVQCCTAKLGNCVC